MFGRKAVALALVAVAAFVGGSLVTQPSRAQPREDRPAAGPAGRYQAVPMAPGNLAVVDTSSGETWHYAGNLNRWTGLGIPAKKAN